MEISGETKKKVFAHYYGQRVLKDGTNLHVVSSEWNWAHPSFKLLLKPLSKISDEDAEIVGKIIMGDFKPLENGRAFIRQMDKRESCAIELHPLNTFSAFQFLISRGYDLPNYLLGGKTLKECDLCNYE